MVSELLVAEAGGFSIAAAGDDHVPSDEEGLFGAALLAHVAASAASAPSVTGGAQISDAIPAPAAKAPPRRKRKRSEAQATPSGVAPVVLPGPDEEADVLQRRLAAEVVRDMPASWYEHLYTIGKSAGGGESLLSVEQRLAMLGKKLARPKIWSVASQRPASNAAPRVLRRGMARAVDAYP